MNDDQPVRIPVPPAVRPAPGEPVRIGLAHMRLQETWKAPERKSEATRAAIQRKRKAKRWIARTKRSC